MKIYKNFSFVALLFPVLSFADSNYTVRKGDTILKIADKTIGIANNKKDPRRYQFAREILAKNPGLKEPNNLEPGQIIILPDFKKPKAVPAKVEAPAQKEEMIQSEKMILPPSVPKPEPLPEITAPPIHEPVVVETPAPPEAPKVHEKHSDFFFLQPRLQTDSYHLKNKATEQKLELTSQANYGLTLGYGKAWGERSYFVIEAGASSIQMKNFAEEELTLDKRSIWLKNFALGIETHMASSLHLQALVTAADYLVMVPDGTGTYFLKSLVMPGAELALIWEAIHLNSSALGLQLTAGYIGDGSLDGLKYKTGFEPAGSVFWKSENGGDRINYRVDLRAGVSSQDSELMEQHATNNGLRFTMMFPL